ncbi:hypothetical protein Tco_1273136 [Tanacetum coccineum]
MAEEQAIVYAPQWNNMTVDNVIFLTNNVVGDFNYPPNVPAYKPIMKFLLNCPLNKAFTNCPSVLYQNYLREFWSTTVAYDPFPPTNETEQRPLREFLIKFLVLNGQRPLTLDFNTLCSSTGLDYNNGKYVAHPTPEVLGGNHSFTEQVNSIQQLLAYYLITRFKVDIGEIIYMLLGCDYTQDVSFGFLPGILSNSNFTKDPSKVTNIELTAHMIAVNNQKDSVSPLPFSGKKKKVKSQTVTPTLPKSQGPEASESLPQKRKKPQSKKEPKDTKATSTPKPTEGSDTGLPSTLDEGIRKSQPLPKGTTIDPKDSVGNKQPIDMGLPSTTSNEGTAKTTSRPEGPLGDKDSRGNKTPADMEPINPSVSDPSGTGAKYQVDQSQSIRLRYQSDAGPNDPFQAQDQPFRSLERGDRRESTDPISYPVLLTTSQSLTKNKGEPSFEGELDSQPLVLSTYVDVRAFLLSDDEAQESDEDILGAGEEVDEDPQAAAISHQSSSPQADKPQSVPAPATEASDSDSSSDDLLKKYENTLPLTERQLTDKLVEASMSSLDKSNTATSDFYKGLQIITELLKEIKNAVKDDPAMNNKINEATKTFTKISTNIIEAHALTQDEELAAWAKSSTNMAWNLGSRLLGLERAQNHIQSSMSSLQADTLSIKSMMTEMYQVFKGQSSSAPSSSVTPTLALTHIPANVEGENEPNTVTEDPSSHTEGETDANKQEKPENLSTQQMLTLKGKGIAMDERAEDQRKLVKASSIVRPDPDAPVLEEQIKKAEEESMLLAINKLEVIKVVREEAKKLGIHPKEVITAKAGENFKKAQDAEHEVLKKQHTKKVRKSLELRKHKYDNYMWTISSRLKLKKITDIKIYPKTKPVVITVYRGTEGRNFDVHNPFAFGEFGISELDELREIIPRKKNAVRKHMELEPEIKIPGLECNRTLPENVSFVNNMVIEEPEYGIFFTDEFGDQAFQRWSDINKVGMEALVFIPCSGSMVQSPENARFSMKLKKLIAEHPDQEKLKSKKVKLEALGYEMD